MAFDVFKYEGELVLESGVKIPGYHLGYTTFGEMTPEKDNVIWIFHALTANSDPSEWWPSMVGAGKCFDPAKYFIVCVNMPGSCYGSLGPLDVNPETGEKYYEHFPFFTTRDMVRSYKPLLQHLGIEKIKAGIGGSMGGQQLLEWAIEEPELFEFIFPLATNAFHSPWGRAFNASQRFSIEKDPTWKEKTDGSGIEGMKIARSVALLSYRHYETYEKTQMDENLSLLNSYRSESYQRYQGEKLAKRFNAYSYYFLSMGMDAHNVGRGRGSVEEALKKIKAKTFVMGIETDVLFPVSEQKFLAEHIPGASFHLIKSFYGHDGFLLEDEQISKVVNSALATSQL
ncbi:MAG: homoserine O-acetyltransferase [Chitinophagaceae bacterium]|nr:homoserine O-acetyltransferase [Chitinophagaceae bacterium]